MPAIMVLRSIDNPVPDSPRKWLAGESVDIFGENYQFGYKEMPLRVIPDRTVAQVNASAPANIPLYGTTTVLDGGTITIGSRGDLDVLVGDVIVWQFGDYFVNYGPRIVLANPPETLQLDPDPLEFSAVVNTDNEDDTYYPHTTDGVFTDAVLTLDRSTFELVYGAQRFATDTDKTPGDYSHLKITNKTVEEVNLYLEEFNKKLTYESLQYDSGTDQRRWRTNNVRVSASGNNGFNAQGIADITTEWNARDPLTGEEPNPNPITLFDTDNLTYATYDGVMPNEYFDAWKVVTQSIGLSDFYANRRWRVTPAGLNAIAANDGFMAGTAAQVVPFLRDGLLD